MEKTPIADLQLAIDKSVELLTIIFNSHQHDETYYAIATYTGISKELELVAEQYKAIINKAYLAGYKDGMSDTIEESDRCIEVNYFDSHYTEDYGRP